MTEPSTSLWSQDVFAPADRRAREDWDIACTSVGHGTNPHYVLAVRHRSGRSSRVLVTTNDPHRLNEIEGAARRALASLCSSDFERLLSLSLPAAPVPGAEVDEEE